MANLETVEMTCVPFPSADGDENDDPDLRRNSRRYSFIRLQSFSSGVGRETWGNKTQFLMSCIASAVGLGNVWRFPAICAKWGGASFFIPYMIVLFVVARPLFLLELALGQFSSKGSVRCWDLSPIFAGLGYAGCASSVLLSTFYILLMAWALIYATLSVVSMVGGEVVWGNASGPYFGNQVLRAIEFDSEDNTQFLSWVPVCHLVLALLLAWLIIWATMVRGVEASGKIAYVTALVPYLVLIILVVVGFCLEGSMLGVTYFIVPDFELILDPQTWYEAVGQCFFSLGIGFGGLIMFSSFNDFRHNIFRDVLVISVVDFFTSVLAGISLMTILGFQATQFFKKLDSTGLEDLRNECKLFGDAATDDALKMCRLKQIVADGGAGLAFVQYPAAMYEINENWGKHLGGFLAFLFFFMIILLAIGSANGFVGTTVTIISDRKPTWKRSNIVTCVCVFSFIAGLIYTNRFGSNWIDVVDTHGVTAVVYILGFFEVIAIVVVYGLKNFCDDLEFMRNGKKVHWYFKITWVMLPVFLVLVYVAWLAKYKTNEHWTVFIKIIAWMITAGCLLIIPIVGILRVVEFKKNPWLENIPGNAMEILKAVTRPSPKWGPSNKKLRAEWKEFKQNQESSYNVLHIVRNFTKRRANAQWSPIEPSVPNENHQPEIGAETQIQQESIA